MILFILERQGNRNRERNGQRDDVAGSSASNQQPLQPYGAYPGYQEDKDYCREQAVQVSNLCR